MIALIFKEVGIPSSSRWPAFAKMPHFYRVTKAAPGIRQQIMKYGRFVVLRKCGSAIGDKYFGLLRATLELVPAIRWTASQALGLLADLE